MESQKDQSIDNDMIIIPVTDQNTKNVLESINCAEVTYKELKTQHDPRKVRKAMQILETMSCDLNNLLAGMNEELSNSVRLIGEVTIVKRYQKKHEGRIKEHLKLGENIDLVKTPHSTFIRVKTKNPENRG